MGTILEDVGRLLAHQKPLPTCSLNPYVDSLSSHVQHSRSQSLDFWKALLRRFSAPQPLRSYILDPNTGACIRSVETLELDISRTILENRSREMKIAHSTVIYAAWALVLSVYTSSGQVAFGAVLSGRTLPVPGIEHLVAPVINTCPFPVKLSESTPTLAFLKDIYDQHMAISDFQWGVAETVGEIWLDSLGSLFDTVVAIECDLSVSTRANKLGGLHCTISRQDFPEFKLTLFIELGKDGGLTARAVFDQTVLSANDVK